MDKQIKELVEWAAKTLCEADGHRWGLTSVPMMHKTYLSKARIILSHPNLALIDENQSLSEAVKEKLGYSSDIDKGQLSLANNGWIKVIHLREEIKEEQDD